MFEMAHDLVGEPVSTSPDHALSEPRRRADWLPEVPARMALRHVTLDDKYDLTQSRVFVTGFQALVRLCLMQRERDRRAGLNTAGLVRFDKAGALPKVSAAFSSPCSSAPVTNNTRC